MFFMLILLVNCKIPFDGEASRSKVMTHCTICQCGEDIVSLKSKDCPGTFITPFYAAA